ncbi:MAG: UDP-N-acetylglucosamine 2-epimerase (non-hydrolyzing) [Alphaproteobacteria bacterium]|nr:UDP-N-acetylglucosamine 2-epimerase (non-hydrolyzing) [Alphaproteobacteria bacterium]MCB9697340.1 UDP-N-acetylglucosamine 2-epimerase (non-hydrolyzing) [Alphaproteobacteria bacterium]
MKLLVVVGTRPEAIKMAPVVVGLRGVGVPTVLVTSGQHPRLATEALAVFGLTPDIRLEATERGENDLGPLLADVIARISPVLTEEAPSAVLVHGDTTTALGAALAAMSLRIPIGHVEAGLRTGDRSTPFPEELNRVLIDRLSTWCFAPTRRAREILLREGHPEDRVLTVGNPIVDAVRYVQRQVELTACSQHPELAPFDLDDLSEVVLVTAHRRENIGPPLRRICAAVRKIPARVVWPLHPNPELERIVREELEGAEHVTLLPPLSYPAMVRLMLRSQVVLTDSGGVQEEASVLGRPTLVLRELTERPEVLEGGLVKLVGTATADIAAAATTWLDRTPTMHADDAPLGDGRTGERIGRWFGSAFGPLSP